MYDYLLIAAFVLAQGFFSGNETGFYCLNRVRLRFRAEEGWPNAAVLRKVVSLPQIAISTLLIGTNLSVYSSTAMCAQKLQEAGVEGADFYCSLIMPPILLIFAEIIPKSLFQRRADTLMYRTAPALRLCRILFYPLLLVLRGVLFVMERTTGRSMSAGEEVFTVEKLRFFLSQGAALGVLSPYQQAMADNILRVKSRSLTQAMLPLDQVASVPDGARIEELKEVLKKRRYSRIPVYAERPDHIVGVINVIDVLSQRDPQQTVGGLMRKPVYLDQRLSVAGALYTLQRRRQQMAVVMGEQGAVGIVTVKDLVEEIVGELRAW